MQVIRKILNKLKAFLTGLVLFPAKILMMLLVGIIYTLVLFITYYIHAQYFTVNVVLYSAIADGLIAGAVILPVLFFSRFCRIFNGFEKIQILLLCLFAGYIFAITVPAVIDRSLSLYILEKLQQRGGGIELAQFEKVFTEEYVKEHRLLDVRLTEQQESGTIVIQNGCVKLTERGQRLASIGRFFRQNILPKKRLLMGEYSDDLTDPFRDSRQNLGYECR